SILFFHALPTTEIYTLSLHDALPILPGDDPLPGGAGANRQLPCRSGVVRSVRAEQPVRGSQQTLRGDDVLETRLGLRGHRRRGRSEEHTSELQSRGHLVCRLLLEKKK